MNVWDAVDYLQQLWSLWLKMRAAREQGSTCQTLSNTLGLPALFDADDIQAFDTIMAKVKARGLQVLAQGGDRILTIEDIMPAFGGWTQEDE